MKNVRVSSRVTACGTLIAFILIALGLNIKFADATPILMPYPASVNAGDQVTLTLTDTLPQVDPLLGGVQNIDLDVTFDPTLLNLVDVGLGNLLVGWGTPFIGPVILNGSPSSGTALVSISECGLCIDAGGATGSVTDSVVNLMFQALSGDAPTSTEVTLDVPLQDQPLPNEYNLSDNATSVVDPVNITAAVASVPEPPSGSFFLVGAAALLMFRNRLFPRRRAVPE